LALSQNGFHNTCGSLHRKPAEKNGLGSSAPDDCGKPKVSPSLFRIETRSSELEGTAILSKPLQCDAEFFRTHPLLPLLRKKTWF
jgi:hypothetical protein